MADAPRVTGKPVMLILHHLPPGGFQRRLNVRQRIVGRSLQGRWKVVRRLLERALTARAMEGRGATIAAMISAHGDDYTKWKFV
jgi:hypothetical protein